MLYSVIWDLEDDPDGNYRHIVDGNVAPEEVHEVLMNSRNPTVLSRTSGRPVTFGWASTGRYIAVVWELVNDDPRMIYPVTAYPTDPPKARGKR